MVDWVEKTLAEDEQAMDEVYDASDPQAVNAARKKEARKKKERLQFIRDVMSDPRGRNWVYEELEACHIFDNPFYGERTHDTAFALGEANRGRKLFQDVLRSSPDLYLSMMEEANQR